MSSIGGTRLAMCMQRYGPLAWASMLCCHRQGSKVASLMVPLNGAAHPTGCRRMSTIAGRKNTEPFGVDLQDFRRELKVAEKIRKFRRFIADPSMAKTLLKCLQPWDDRGNRPIILECDPGPGVFTQTLLAAGARVVALESNKDFLPSLKDLQNNMDGQLEVLHCDFFKLDPLGHGTMQPPVMYSNVLFNSLCIPEVPWTKDVPFKVFGILPQKTESAFLWKQIYNLYERNSIYRYGRIELNVFLSEKQYMKLVSQPGDMRSYQALSALFQASCDIELLHMYKQLFEAMGCSEEFNKSWIFDETLEDLQQNAFSM
ncbi:hypothetical protein XELAEV_18026793mg [Xenopus laevis]|uniref:rRNA adenine N(6)-methyltransferase n=1 Tax=Xenopus laevis TaxID=8355 RepID=A0A974CWT6_XENLA|nr:hypothetical protein XELAEV_18026793mg [Xenopus laevis]